MTQSVFADDDDDDDKKKDKKSKTLESECEKKTDKKNLNLDGLFCIAIFTIQQQIDSLQNQLNELSFSQEDPEKPIVELKVNPTSTAPALVVKNENNDDLFQVRNDGSLKIGSDTVIINPDGTINAGGQPLIVLASAGQTVNLQEWKDSTGVTLASIDANGVITGDGSGLINIDTDSTNELQTLDLSDSTLTLSNGGGNIILPSDTLANISCNIDDAIIWDGSNWVCTNTDSFLSNDFTGPITADEFVFSNPKSFLSVVTPSDFSTINNDDVISMTTFASSLWFDSTSSGFNQVYAKLDDPPKGANITKFICRVSDLSDTHLSTCQLMLQSIDGQSIPSIVSTTLEDTPGAVYLIDSSLNLIHNENGNYYVIFEPSPGCAESCRITGAYIQYSTSEAQ